MMFRENWKLKTYRKLKIKENFRKLEKMTKLVKTILYQRRYTGKTSEKKPIKKQKKMTKKCILKKNNYTISMRVKEWWPKNENEKREKNFKLRKLITTILNQWGYTGMIIKNTIQNIFQKNWKVEET